MGIVVLGLALGFASTAEAFGFALLALGGATALLALVVGVWALGGLAKALVFGAAFTVSMISFRVGAEVTLADTFLGVAFVLVLALSIGKYSNQLSRAAGMRWHFPVVVLVLLVVVGGLGGTFSASDQTRSLAELGRFAASSVVVVLLFWLWAPSKSTLRQICWVLVLGASTNAVLSLFLERFGDRAMGLSGHPNHLALACSLAIGVTLGLTFSSPSLGRQTFLAVCLAALGVAVIESGSRAALVGSVVTIAAFLVVTRRWTLIAMGAAAAGFASIAIYLNWFAIGELNAVNRMQGDLSAAASDRIRGEMAQEAVDIILLNPVVGSGFQSAKAAHSIYLQLWASAGFLGLVFAVGLVVITVRMLLTAGQRSDLLAIGLASSYVGYLTAGAVSNILWDRYVWLHLAVLLTLIATRDETKELAEARSGRAFLGNANVPRQRRR